MMLKSKLRRVAMVRKVTPQSIVASNWPPPSEIVDRVCAVSLP